MVKHLYFNPINFQQLVLSGVLIQIYKDDIEVHSCQQGLKFVSGSRVVENSIEAILKHATLQTKKKYFGLSRQQQAVINMVNGVCKDIDRKIDNALSSQELNQKIGYLNQFWKNPSNQWIKKQFYYTHMIILNLSFRVQQKFPQLLSKFTVFVDLRRDFISGNLLSKKALIAMFTNPLNKYQQFDLFPQTESEVSLRSSFGRPSQNEQDIAKMMVNAQAEYVQIQALQMTEQEQRTNHIKQLNQRENEQKQMQQMKQTNKNENAVQIPNGRESLQINFKKINKELIAQQLSTQNNNFQDNNHHDQDKDKIIAQSDLMVQNNGDPSQIVKSDINEQMTTVVTQMQSQIKQTLQQPLSIYRQISSEQIKNVQHNSNNQHSNDNMNKSNESMKKSLKQSFSQNFSKPLQYSTKSLTRQQQQHKHSKQTHQIKHQNHHQQHEQQKIHNKQQIKQGQKMSNQKQEIKQVQKLTESVQLKKQVIIDQAQSEKYVSQQVVQHVQLKVDDAHKAQQESKVQEPKVQIQKQNPQINQNKAPQSQSSRSHQAPVSDMNKSPIRPKEQPVERTKQSCKCEIF